MYLSRHAIPQGSPFKTFQMMNHTILSMNGPHQSHYSSHCSSGRVRTSLSLYFSFWEPYWDESDKDSAIYPCTYIGEINIELKPQLKLKINCDNANNKIVSDK